MFIDTIPNRKSPPAVLLRESYREGGRVKSGTLANLSKLPRALIDGIAALLDGGKVSGKRAAEPGFEIVRSLPHGHVAAVKAVIGKLGLERTLQGRSGVDKRVRNLIEAMIIQRIVAPGSKLAFHRALAPMTATSSLALSVGLIEVAEREVYAALDWLIEQQTRIEAALAQRHLADRTLFFTQCIIELHGGPLLRAGQARLQPGSSARPSADRIRIDVRTGRHARGRRGVRGQHQRPADDPRADRQDQTPFQTVARGAGRRPRYGHVGADQRGTGASRARLDQLPQGTADRRTRQ